MTVLRSSITLHEPGSAHESLADGPNGFDRSWFMGKWVVAWSTLPLWKVNNHPITLHLKLIYASRTRRVS